MLELFAEDATMELPSETHEGKTAIRAMFEGVAERTGPRQGAAAKFTLYLWHQITTVRYFSRSVAAGTS